MPLGKAHLFGGRAMYIKQVRFTKPEPKQESAEQAERREEKPGVEENDSLAGSFDGVIQFVERCAKACGFELRARG